MKRYTRQRSVIHDRLRQVLAELVILVEKLELLSQPLSGKTAGSLDVRERLDNHESSSIGGSPEEEHCACGGKPDTGKLHKRPRSGPLAGKVRDFFRAHPGQTFTKNDVWIALGRAPRPNSVLRAMKTLSQTADTVQRVSPGFYRLIDDSMTTVLRQSSKAPAQAKDKPLRSPSTKKTDG